MSFDPLALSRPIWELRCGMTSIGDKLVHRTGATDVAGFVPPYMADACRETTDRPVNDASVLAGEDILLVDGRVKAESLDVDRLPPGGVVLGDDGNVLVARISQSDRGTGSNQSIEAVLKSAGDTLRRVDLPVKTWNYTWELILANPDQLTEDFRAAGMSGIEGTVEQPNAIRGSKKDVFIAPGVVVHPMVVLDAEHGPVYIDEGAEIHPFTRIEGPCYVGKKSILLGAKCREGNSIGPMCRIGGEVEESIIHGYSNKYHDGFLGHAYVGEWVNLGALTTNSDLKNDYSDVSVILDGRRAIDGITQGRVADRRSHEDVDWNTVQHRCLCRSDGADRRDGQASAEVHSLLCLVSGGRRNKGLWQTKTLRHGEDRDGPPGAGVDGSTGGDVGSHFRSYGPGKK